MANNTKNTESLLAHFKLMVPHAEVRWLNQDCAQLFWDHNDGRENSITIFSPEEAAQMKMLTKHDNDIKWIDNVRFSSTI